MRGLTGCTNDSSGRPLLDRAMLAHEVAQRRHTASAALAGPRRPTDVGDTASPLSDGEDDVAVRYDGAVADIHGAARSRSQGLLALAVRCTVRRTPPRL